MVSGREERFGWSRAAVAAAVSFGCLSACGVSGARHQPAAAPGPPGAGVTTTRSAPTTADTTIATTSPAPPTSRAAAAAVTSPVTSAPQAAAVPVSSAPKAPACPVSLAGQLASTGGASQVVTVDAPFGASTTATLTAWQRSGRCWVTRAGPWAAHVGYNGLSDHHVEGDGTTPAGAFGIGPVMYGLGPNPGTSYAYHPLVCGDWWDEDPQSPQYNTFQHVACGMSPPFGGGSEALWTETLAYRSFALIDYNTTPVVPGRGSAVFLHVDKGGPTLGCVSLPATYLDVVLRWLQPAGRPLIVIGTDAEIRRF